MSNFGRNQIADKQRLLDAIKHYRTTEKAKLRKLLGVSRATIYRYFEGVTEQEINEALGVVSSENLTPAQYKEFDVFCQIKEIKEWYEATVYKREASEQYTRTMLRHLWRICKRIQVHPLALTVEMASDFIMAIKKGETADGKPITQFGSGYNARRAFRSWFGFRDVSGARLTNAGIHARLPKPKDRNRSHARFTQEMRHKIRDAARKHYNEDWRYNKKTTGHINFRDDPNLAAAMDAWFEFKYYTMTRSSATLKCCWEIKTDENGNRWGVEWQDHAVLIHLVDKGKRGGLPWTKKLLGQAAENFKTFYEMIGKPKTGLIFPFGKGDLRCFLVSIYKEAEIPPHLWRGMTDHIWRHTGAQDALASTGWNRAIVAAWGGWESEQVLKDNYGEVPPEVQENAIRGAMGEEIIQIKREFVY